MAVDFQSLLNSNLQVNLGPLNGILINLFLSTIVGGIVFLIAAKLIGKKFHESVGIIRAFLAIFVINLLSIPLVLGYTANAISSISILATIYPFLPLILWFAVIKIVFRQMTIGHALIISVIGYILSLFVIPTLVITSRAFLPF